MKIGDTVECIKLPVNLELVEETTPAMANHNKVVKNLVIGKQYTIQKTLFKDTVICVEDMWVAATMFKLIPTESAPN